MIFRKWKRDAPPPRTGGTENVFAGKFDPASRLFNSNSLLIEQHARSWYEILLSWEQRNQYAIRDGMGAHRGAVVEQGVGLGAALARVLLGSHRPLELIIFGEHDHEIILTLERPFYWFLSDMRVEDGAGRILGRVVKKLTLARKVYELSDASGRMFGRIVSGIFRIWTFPVLDSSGQQIALISKKWGGLLKEYMTDADQFAVDYTSPTLSVEQRAVIFAAALSIDFDYFENNQKK